MIEFSFLEQHLWLLAERALYWHEARTVVVADVHFGKAATFRAHGIALPAGTTAANLARLTSVLQQTRAERLLIVGDLLHAKKGRAAVVEEQVAVWRQQFHSLAIDLVLGNHDQQAGRPPESWGMRCVEGLVERPFVWRHQPDSSAAGYVMAGHVHPAVRLRGRAEAITLPCFYFGHDYGLLPAFGDFTGFGVVRPRAGECVFVVAEDELVRFDC